MDKSKSMELRLSVSVVYAARARTVVEYRMELKRGTTVGDALRSTGLLDSLGKQDCDELALGVWGRKASGTQALRDGDRVEVIRPLRVDPKVARRVRFQKQGVRSAGLFAKRRSNAKPGY